MRFPKFLFFLFLIIFVSCKKEAAKPTILDFNLEKAESFNAAKQYSKAYAYYNKSLAYNRKINYNKRVIYCLLKMASIETTECDYATSEETITKAISLFDKDTDISYRTNALNFLGQNYAALNDFDAALEVYEKVLAITNDELTKATAQNNIAYVYSKKSEFKKAISILSEIENNKYILDSLQDYYIREHYARVLHNKGFYLFHLKEDSALEYMLKALEIREQDKDDSQIVSSYMHLANYYINVDNREAYNWAKKAYVSASNANIPDDKLEALNLLFKTSENSNLKDEHYSNYIRINDSLIKARQQAKNQFAKIRYDSSLATQKAETQEKQKIIFLLLLVLSVFIAFFIIYFIRKKNQRKLKKVSYETEKRISKRLHDELANDVFNAITYIETQDLHNLENKETLLEGLDSIYAKARNISKQNSEIKTGKNFGFELNEMLTHYNSKQVNVIVKGSDSIDWEKTQIEKQIEIYRVVQELLVNMKKHSKSNLVLFSFEVKEKNIEIKYSDNGIGLDLSNISKNGLQNVENRIQGIKGNITFDSEIGKGLKITIVFPK